MEDEIDICPPWWPNLLWWLHHRPRPLGGDGPLGPGGPVNYPPAIDDLMSSLTMHTMSYLLLDQEAAREIRGIAERQMIKTVQNLSRYHDDAADELNPQPLPPRSEGEGFEGM